MAAPSPHRVRPASCTWCGQPLNALRAMRREVCERPSCLLRHDERVLRAARTDVAAGLRSQRYATLGKDRAQALQVVWIVPHSSRLVDLPAAVRQRQRSHLLALTADAAAAAAPLPSDARQPQRAEGQLCGWCAGRCCRYGGDHHAYLNASHLQRWRQQHPGRSLHDAALAYIDRLPRQHVDGSCPYHGETGCTLDRGMRSQVCNDFACDGLRDVQRRAAAAPQDEWLFVMGARAEVDSQQLAPSDQPSP